MTALDLIQGLSQALYVIVFVLAAWRYVRDSTPAHLDMALFFAILAFFVVESRIVALLGVTAPLPFTDIVIVAILALPYVLLRLVDDFTNVPPLLKRATEIALIGLSLVFIGLYAPPAPLPPPYTIALIAYMAVISLYSGAAFILASRRSEGVTRRRMQSVSLGALLFAVQIVTAGAASLFAEPDRTLLAGIVHVSRLRSAVAFYCALTP